MVKLNPLKANAVTEIESSIFAANNLDHIRNRQRVSLKIFRAVTVEHLIYAFQRISLNRSLKHFIVNLTVHFRTLLKLIKLGQSQECNPVVISAQIDLIDFNVHHRSRSFLFRFTISIRR